MLLVFLTIASLTVSQDKHKVQHASCEAVNTCFQPPGQIGF